MSHDNSDVVARLADAFGTAFEPAIARLNAVHGQPGCDVATRRNQYAVKERRLDERPAVIGITRADGYAQRVVRPMKAMSVYDVYCMPANRAIEAFWVATRDTLADAVDLAAHLDFTQHP